MWCCTFFPIHVLVTMPATDGDAAECVVQVATVFGRPKWDKIFKDIKKDHPGKRVGVFVCGPVVRAYIGRCSRRGIVCILESQLWPSNY